MWKEYIIANNKDQVLGILDQYGSKAKIVAGATDLILEIERGGRKGVDTLVDISRLGPEWDRITLDELDNIHVGPLITHSQCVDSKLIRERAYPLAKACWEVGSPQIRNRGTIAGNLITASPANDTITPLVGLNARVVLESKKNGRREILLENFYTGVRKTVMEPDELLVDIYFPALKINQSGDFIKYALRKAQAISVVNISVILTVENNIISQASITMGAVAPTIIHASDVEKYLKGKNIQDRNAINESIKMITEYANPISDIRSSLQYRKKILGVIAKRAIDDIIKNIQDIPDIPIFLFGKNRGLAPKTAQSFVLDAQSPIITRVNGKEFTIYNAHHKTLLRLIREDIGLTGTKEGCAEGECGACTLDLDGMTVMACMIPAGRAHMAEITTIEGIGTEDQLHPVQKTFIQDGAVQCGYCTPGFIMSAVKLLDECPQPSTDQIKQAITGNLCRCTGYYKIIQAIEDASKLT